MHRLYNEHAQNYTTYAQNGAFTNGTPQLVPYKCIMLHKFDGNVTFDMMTYWFSRIRRNISVQTVY